MDPNETLRRIRQIVASRDAHGQRVELCELVRALDEWLTAGGFLPDAWRPANSADCQKAHP